VQHKLAFGQASRNTLVFIKSFVVQRFLRILYSNSSLQKRFTKCTLQGLGKLSACLQIITSQEEGTERVFSPCYPVFFRLAQGTSAFPQFPKISKLKFWISANLKSIIWIVLIGNEVSDAAQFHYNLKLLQTNLILVAFFQFLLLIWAIML